MHAWGHVYAAGSCICRGWSCICRNVMYMYGVMYVQVYAYRVMYMQGSHVYAGGFMYMQGVFMYMQGDGGRGHRHRHLNVSSSSSCMLFSLTTQATSPHACTYIDKIGGLQTGRHQYSGLSSDIRWCKNDGLQHPCGRDDGELFCDKHLPPVGRFSLHRPMRQANEQFALEHRMEIHFSNLSVAAALQCI